MVSFSAQGRWPNQFDTINHITHWVERGEAPDELIVSGPDPQNPSMTRTRPVFPYPQRAVYSGSGSIDEAANFTGAPPTAAQRSDLHWIGEFLYDQPPMSPLLEDAWESGDLHVAS